MSRSAQAVAYAIDKQKIIEGAYWGQGEATEERFFKGSPWHFGFPERKRDLSKARDLLKDAGYKGEKIVFVARQGQEEVTLYRPSAPGSRLQRSCGNPGGRYLPYPESHWRLRHESGRRR